MREVHTEAPSRVFPLVSATRMQDITQRGELWGVGQGFVTCYRAGIPGDPPRLASTQARRSGGGSGAPLTSLRCGSCRWPQRCCLLRSGMTPPVGRCPELCGQGIRTCLSCNRRLVPAKIGYEVVSGLEGLGWFWLRRVTGIYLGDTPRRN